MINAEEIVTGGTGYKDFGSLPPEVEACQPDYTLYPNWKPAIGFLTRGCFRSCDFCIVPRKEGPLHPAASWEEVKRLYDLLQANGLAEKVYLDFSVEGDMDYYSGIVFRGFLKGLPRGVLSGGQYDKMVEKMGKRCGAIGFAIYLNELERLDTAPRDFDADVLLWYDEASDFKHLSQTAAKLRREGRRVLARRERAGVRTRETLDLRGGAEE